MVLEAIGGMVFTAILITLCIWVLRRTGGGGADKRVFGPPIPGDELTQHEHDLALQNLTTMNQQDILRRNGKMPG